MSIETVQPLTALSSCAGCAAKLGQKALRDVLHDLPQKQDRALLVGSATSDDAGVYQLDEERALVQTLDFFTPIVDDPDDYGRIAAANALSDVYAMGGRPITAMNIVGMPTDKVPPDVMQRILRGGADKVLEANCSLVGGHSIRSVEPIYGLSVTGLVKPDQMIHNAGAQPGDALVLTKPLGTGIATTAIKRGLASGSLVERVTHVMQTLNDVGPSLAERRLVHAGTDVTGFGLLGHLMNICRASRVAATITAERLPVLADEILALLAQGCIPGGTRTNLELARESVCFEDTDGHLQYLLADAQTSGGLLLCVAPEHLEATQALLRDHHTLANAVIGEIVSADEPAVTVR